MAAVLRSLFRNSAQAGASRVVISIERRDDGRTMDLAVEDDGSGLSSEVLSHLGMPFDGTRPAGEATGLGLYLVRTYVAVVGGSVEANNRPEGGARFLLRLPCQLGTTT
jgi:signal transduction histidine kinase